MREGGEAPISAAALPDGARSIGRRRRGRVRGMNNLIILALALAGRGAASKAELRFSGVLRQEGRSSCALAAAASLLSLYCSTPADEAGLAAVLERAGASPGPDGRYALADIGTALSAAGVESRPYRMDGPQLGAALAAGYAPIVVHYRKPLPHFALLLAAIRPWEGAALMILADPARGLEVLPAAEFASRWSGAVALVPREAASGEGRSRIAAMAVECACRALLLARGIAR